MNKPITSTEMETVFLKTSHKHIPGPDGSQMNSIKHLFFKCDAKVVCYDIIYVKLSNIYSRNDQLHPWESSMSHKGISIFDKVTLQLQ